MQQTRVAFYLNFPLLEKITFIIKIGRYVLEVFRTSALALFG